MSALLTAREVSERLRVDRRTVSRWASSGRLPAMTLPNGHLRFAAQRVEALEAQLRGAEGER